MKNLLLVSTNGKIWKHEFNLIQSIDWNKILDADSQIKLLIDWKSRDPGVFGGVTVNRLERSVINGPEKIDVRCFPRVNRTQRTFNLIPETFFGEKFLLFAT